MPTDLVEHHLPKGKGHDLCCLQDAPHYLSCDDTILIHKFDPLFLGPAVRWHFECLLSPLLSMGASDTQH